LLIEVFLDVFAQLDEANRFASPFKLAGVSRRWRELFLTTPYLWTYTFYGGRHADKKLIAIQLARSASLPLDVAICWKGLEHDAAKMILTITSLAGRVKSLELRRSPASFTLLRSSQHFNITMFPLMEDAKLQLGNPTQVKSFLTQHSQLKRLHLINPSNFEFPSPSFRYHKLTTLIFRGFTMSVENIRLLFLEMPQIEAFQLLRERGRDSDGVIPTIVAPCLRRLCVAPRVTLLDAHMHHTHRWGMRLIRAFEAPKLRELAFSLKPQYATEVHITHMGEDWGVKFPKLDVLELRGVWLEGEDLREMLLASAGLREVRFWRRGTTGRSADFVDVLTELVERGELARLEVVDLRDVDVRVLHEGLKERKKRLPLRMKIDRCGPTMDGDVDDLVDRVKEIVDLEVCGHSRSNEWTY
ncbi:hypothetical protein FRB99_005128, partial [Tulasnella sp. 403]